MEVVNGTARPLEDRMFLRPLEWDASNIVIAIRHGRPVRGEVMAIGRGHYPIRYIAGYDKQGRYSSRAKMVRSDHFRPTEVKIGDVVELGGLNAFDGEGFKFEEVLYNGERCLICTERDVAGVVTA
jgi:co-chaperonin GroES (HSP10)